MLFSLTAHTQAAHSQTYRFNAERNMIKTEQNTTNPPSHHLAPPVVTASPPFANTAEPVEKNNNKVQPKEQNDDDSNTAFQYETEYNLQNRKFVKKVQIVEIVEIE